MLQNYEFFMTPPSIGYSPHIPPSHFLIQYASTIIKVTTNMIMRSYKAILALLLFCYAGVAISATHLFRLTWDSDPAHEAIVGFSPKGVSVSPYVLYGTSADEGQWQREEITYRANFFSLESYFVRLTDLPADSAIYFKVCDFDGCAPPLWFKTASNEPAPFTAIAGGDTRTGWTTRQEGNKLVAKIRPLFVMHGGDFTNGNTPFEMAGFLDDWQLTFSDDVIDGKSFKRIYPIIPTHGNHEDTNYATLCQVFGVDFVRDNNCDEQDTYGALTVNQLARIYTLNSQYQESGWQVYANQMNAWLTSDLQSNQHAPIWRIAQYHKPIFPHFDGKSSNEGLFQWWATLFHKHNMNLVVESDTHINKLTYPLAPQPNTTAFYRSDNGGTVYVGEGSWGAPARSANQSYPWTVDLASIQQFKVISVTANEIKVRTAEFDDGASTLSRKEREANPLALPDNIKWWVANDVGAVFTLTQNEKGLTTYAPLNSENQRAYTLTASHDSFIASAKPIMNYNAYPSGMMVVKNHNHYGEAKALISFDASHIAKCAQLNSATLSFQSNPSQTSAISGLASELLPVYSNPTGVAISLVEPRFSENTVNWNNGYSLFSEDSFATVDVIDAGNNITLPIDKVALLTLQQQFSDYAAFGLGISSDHPVQQRFIDASENHKAPVLHVTFSGSEDCFSTPNNLITPPQSIENLNANRGVFETYIVDAVERARTLLIHLNGGYGNADLYVQIGQEVGFSDHLCRSNAADNTESCVIDVPSGRAVSIGINARTQYQGLHLSVYEN